MARYYPFAIVALSMIYSHTTDADRAWNTDKAVIIRHLVEENDPRYKSPLGSSPDAVYSLTDKEKQNLCDKVASYLIGKQLWTLLGTGNRLVPQIAKSFPAFLSRDVRIVLFRDLHMEKPMYWCESREFQKKRATGMLRSIPTPYSDIDQIDGFFCAGSQIRNDRVYVFRPVNDDAEEVQPVAELNDWSPWG